MTNELVKQITKRPSQQYPSLFRSGLWDDFWAGWDEMENRLENTFIERGGTTPCDIVEIKDENGLVVANEFSYALAGYEKDNVNVEIDDDQLTIIVDKSEEIKDEENKTYIHRGLTKKRMQWSYHLGSHVDATNVTANMENGVLKVRVPLLKKKEIKKIEVQ